MKEEVKKEEGIDAKKSEKEKSEDLEKIEKLEKRCKELEEYAKRLKARFENYKMEVAQEKQMIIKNANEYLVGRLIPILDDLDRALKSAQPTKSFVEGIEKIYKKLIKTLEKEGLTVLEPEGKFDPFEHEAFEKVETSEHEEYEILEVLEKGYKYHGKVLKPAKVKVAVKPSRVGKEDEER